MNYWKTVDLRPCLKINEAARRAGRSYDATLAAYRRHGIQFERKKRGYPDSVRQRAMRLRRDGYTFAAIASATGVSERTLKAWAA